VSTETQASPFVVGIDLGTTNCAVAFVDTTQIDPKKKTPPTIQSFPIPQLVHAGEMGEAALLPSFIYMPAEGEIPPAHIQVPWAKNRDYCVGTFARDHGGKIPTRLIGSAKSWLCHPGIDRRGAVLPLVAEAEFPKISPLEAQVRLLTHLRDAWNDRIAGKKKELRLEAQDIVLTVPASFDAVARELTVEAAKSAGLERLVLFEEPQAAFYSWLHKSGDKWRKSVSPGDVVLVVDVGGGTTDLTLIGVAEEGGDLQLTRLAVGDHLLLGGDNMDLALAQVAAEALKEKMPRPDAQQILGLWHACRVAKENLFRDPKAKPQPVTVLGKGSKLIGGTLKTELSRDQVEKHLVDGFFPRAPLDSEPVRARSTGFQELGLPYAADPAITKHLAAFLRRHADQIREIRGGTSALPTGVLFNGGVFQAAPLRERVITVLNGWTGKAEEVRELPAVDLDQAVAIGAAYYGMARRGRGVRIRGGTARSYYIGVESSLPAVPGMRPPMRAVCIAPMGMEEGTEAELPNREFGLVVGEPVEFKFLGSTQRPDDTVGLIVDEWEDTIEVAAPVSCTLPLESDTAKDTVVPVKLRTKVTEIGTLELWCVARDGRRWKLEFSVREQAE
jgi:hypothetical protein